jgi:hypothetical protein
MNQQGVTNMPTLIILCFSAMMLTYFVYKLMWFIIDED